MRIVSDLIIFVAVAGVVAVWFPQLTTELAEMVGVGRGADLLLYTFVSMSLVVIFGIHLRLKAVDRTLTIIARNIALSNPIPPEASANTSNDGHTLGLSDDYKQS